MDAVQQWIATYHWWIIGACVLAGVVGGPALVILASSHTIPTTLWTVVGGLVVGGALGGGVGYGITAFGGAGSSPVQDAVAPAKQPRMPVVITVLRAGRDDDGRWLFSIAERDAPEGAPPVWEAKADSAGRGPLVTLRTGLETVAERFSGERTVIINTEAIETPAPAVEAALQYAEELGMRRGIADFAE